jgi:hypothetical protein
MACKTHWESCKGANTLDATHVQLGYDEVQEPALRRPQTGLGKWTAEEDAELRALVRNDGPGGWQKKSQNFSTARSASSMSHRWVTLHPKPKEDRPASNVVSSPPSIRTDVGGLVDQSHGMCAGCIVPACAHTCGRAPTDAGQKQTEKKARMEEWSADRQNFERLLMKPSSIDWAENTMQNFSTRKPGQATWQREVPWQRRTAQSQQLEVKARNEVVPRRRPRDMASKECESLRSTVGPLKTSESAKRPANKALCVACGLKSANYGILADLQRLW